MFFLLSRFTGADLLVCFPSIKPFEFRSNCLSAEFFKMNRIDDGLN